MRTDGTGSLNRDMLLQYFLRASTPRPDWRVGMELERMGRRLDDGLPVPYEGDGPSVRGVLEFLLERRGGDPVYEAEHLIGADGAWGTISLEPGGQVEWSSRPRGTLTALASDLTGHVRMMDEAASKLGLRWLEEAVDPDLALDRMTWMPKARYNIMRPFLGARGKLAHRMMTQTASIQCAFDFDGPEDWERKFKVAALMAPLATAIFANSSRIDGRDTGYRCYRQEIWRHTDPDRCGLPSVVFEPHFSLEIWLDWILRVPTIFRHRARGLVPAGGVPFVDLMERSGCDAMRTEDWETHISTIFTEVRSYSYIEVRSADVQPDDRAMAVPTFWTGLLYQADALAAARDLGSGVDDHQRWIEAMESAARLGLEGRAGDRPIRDLAADALAFSIRGLRGGAACAGEDDAKRLEQFAERLGLGPRD